MQCHDRRILYCEHTVYHCWNHYFLGVYQTRSYADTGSAVEGMETECVEVEWLDKSRIEVCIEACILNVASVGSKIRLLFVRSSQHPA